MASMVKPSLLRPSLHAKEGNAKATPSHTTREMALNILFSRSTLAGHGDVRCVKLNLTRGPKTSFRSAASRWGAVPFDKQAHRPVLHPTPPPPSTPFWPLFAHPWNLPWTKKEKENFCLVCNPRCTSNWPGPGLPFSSAFRILPSAASPPRCRAGQLSMSGSLFDRCLLQSILLLASAISPIMPPRSPPAQPYLLAAF